MAKRQAARSGKRITGKQAARKRSAGKQVAGKPVPKKRVAATRSTPKRAAKKPAGDPAELARAAMQAHCERGEFQQALALGRAYLEKVDRVPERYGKFWEIRDLIVRIYADGLSDPTAAAAERAQVFAAYEALRAAGKLDDGLHNLYWTAALGVAGGHADAGRFDEANRILHSLLALLAERRPGHSRAIEVHRDLALVARRAGDLETATRHADLACGLFRTHIPPPENNILYNGHHAELIAPIAELASDLPPAPSMAAWRSPRRR